MENNNQKKTRRNHVGKARLYPKMELPISGLPTGFQQYINEITSVYHCPREFVTTAVLTAVSTVTGNRVTISDGVYNNSLALWFVNIARSGSNKTMPVKAVLKHVAKIDNEIYNVFRHQMQVYEMSEDGARGKKPPYKTIMVGDSTEESRHTILSDNPNGVMGYYPELKGFFDDLQRYNKSGAVARLLRLWDNDTIKVTRKSDPEPLIIPRPFMNILGDLQPGLLKDTFGSKTCLTNGLPQRFLFCYPDTVEFPERSERVVDYMVESTLGRYLQLLYYNDYQYVYDPSDRLNGGMPSSVKQPIITTPVIQLTPSADKLYSAYYNNEQHEKELTDDDYIASIYSKAQIQVLRLAGIIHMCKALEPDKDFFFPAVTDDTMQAAIDCMAYFKYTAMRVYEDINPNAGNKAQEKPEMSETEIIREFHSRFPITNIAKFASIIGKDRSLVSRIINSMKK